MVHNGTPDPFMQFPQYNARNHASKGIDRDLRRRLYQQRPLRKMLYIIGACNNGAGF